MPKISNSHERRFEFSLTTPKTTKTWCYRGIPIITETYENGIISYFIPDLDQDFPTKRQACEAIYLMERPEE